MSSPEVKKGKKPIKGDQQTASSSMGKRKRFDNDKQKGGSGPRPQGAKKGKFHPKGAPAKKKAVYGGERPNGIPGASKLKASIRQTKRLLAKPNLAPGAKIEAERRLTSLTADLETLERSRNEKSIASRYHKVKFFERQKLVRGIKKIKRSIAKLEAKQAGESDSDSSDEESDDDEEKATKSVEQLKDQLRNYRAYLHYVLRFPPDERYVALFPGHTKQPQPPLSSDKDRARAMAYEVLQKIQKGIKSGELNKEPELELERGEAADRANKVRASKTKSEGEKQQKQAKASKDESDAQDVNSDSDSDSESGSDGEQQVQGVKGDDFFAQDSDSEEE